MEETVENIQNGETTPQSNQQNISMQSSNQCSNQISTSTVYIDQETQLETNELETISVKSSDSLSEIYREVAIQSVDLNIACCSTALFPITLLSKPPQEINPPKECPVAGNASGNAAFQESRVKTYDQKIPIIIINSPTNRNPITIQPSRGSNSLQQIQGPITIQPSRTFPSLHSLLSPMSLITSLPNQPQSLFLQALAILNQSSVVINKSLQSERIETDNGQGQSALHTPDSLTSAPPSYSFVLRQTRAMARRRPRHMGTFIPSPSFVTKTPPPNYAQAFDIYVDAPVRHHRPRMNYTFGFAPMPVICPECGYTGLTATQSKITLCTHLCALLLCIFCCWVCAPLPYIMSSCKDVYHYCRNCRVLLGMYSPANPPLEPEPSYTMR